MNWIVQIGNHGDCAPAFGVIHRVVAGQSAIPGDPGLEDLQTLAGLPDDVATPLVGTQRAERSQ